MNESSQRLLTVAIGFSVGLQACEDSLPLTGAETLGLLPGFHLFSIKTDERLLHHCNYDLLVLYIGLFVLNRV